MLALRMERAVHQGPHPRALSERDLPGQPVLRRRRGRAELLRQVAGRAEHWRGGAAGRPAQGAVQLRSRRQPRRRPAAAQLCHRPHAATTATSRRPRPQPARAEPIVLQQRVARRRPPRPTSSSRRSAASWSARLGEQGFYEGGLSVRVTLSPDPAGGRRPGAAARAGRLRPPPAAGAVPGAAGSRRRGRRLAATRWTPRTRASSSATGGAASCFGPRAAHASSSASTTASGSPLGADDVAWTKRPAARGRAIWCVDRAGQGEPTRKPLGAAPAPGGRGRGGGAGSAHRPRAGDERRLQLPPEQVQPRHPGARASRARPSSRSSIWRRWNRA